MMQLPGAVNMSGPTTNAAEDARAEAIIDANKTKSAGQLVHLLKENGIQRSKTWVWRHRV
jgi:arginine repressor